MPQQLEWKLGDLYATAEGHVMTIASVGDEGIKCTDEFDRTHTFDVRGDSLCDKRVCVHTGFVRRISGSVR